MQTFIEETLAYLLSEEKIDLEKTTFILPSKRAGNYLKEILKTKVNHTLFAPEVLSIEEFIERITGLKPLDNTNSIFRFYETYQALTPKKEREDFETFYNWSQTLIYDFNEIDRYLIDAKPFFGYLADIQDINHWSLQEPKTELVENYLQFWHQLPRYYEHFTTQLLENKEAYQGLMYRKAFEEIQTYLQTNSNQLVYIGFNALNDAEQSIIQTSLAHGNASVFWDTDKCFFEDSQHEASLFLRKYKKEWPYFSEENHDFQWFPANFKEPKTIEVIGVPKNIGQAKYIGKLLQDFDEHKLKNTAVVLNDEGLLSPVINSLPENVKRLNITMGLTLEATPPASLFEILFKIQEEDSSKIYFKNALEVLNHTTIAQILGETAIQLQQKINNRNLVFVSPELLINSNNALHQSILEGCFSSAKNNSALFLQRLEKLTKLLRPDIKTHPIESEYLYHFNQVFTKLQNLLEGHSSLKTLLSLQRIYRDMLATESLDFTGSPFSGLQLMGMLESRVLDFETVILTSVNEGVLPAGKSQNSFIPFDLKREYGLPTYKEKDAVYTYHFYRLLQRAKNIYILYNSDKTGFNSGEKSRFITQLEVEHLAQHKLSHRLVSPQVPALKTELKQIQKTPKILEKLKGLATYGFSPSALTSYIRNPLAFYQNYILGIRETEEVEEVIAANTLGTIIHDTLEAFYKPFVNSTINLKELETMEKNIANQVSKEFQKTYQQAPIDQGKNLIVFEIAKRYIYNFLKTEKELLQKENKLGIVAIESNLKTKLEIPTLDFPVYLRGKVDRVDRLNDEIRIVDYKTGRVTKSDLALKDWDLLTTDYKFSKVFQVLSYALMIFEEQNFSQATGGIISFKNLKDGFMPLNDKTTSQKGDYDINAEMLTLFQDKLSELISEIFNPEVPFIEKEI